MTRSVAYFVSIREDIIINSRLVVAQQTRQIYFPLCVTLSIVGIPVVIEGAVDHWPAKQWTLDSLCQHVGQNEVYVRTNTNCHDYRVSFYSIY